MLAFKKHAWWLKCHDLSITLHFCFTEFDFLKMNPGIPCRNKLFKFYRYASTYIHFRQLNPANGKGFVFGSEGGIYNRKAPMLARFHDKGLKNQLVKT